MPYKWLLLMLIIVLISKQTNGLFEDQAGTYDWRQQQVGRPLFSHIDLPKNKLYVASDQNLVGALNIKTGNIAWRKIFETNQMGKIDQVTWGDKDIAVVTGNGVRIQSFDYNSGFSNWEYVLFNNRSQKVEIDSIESVHDHETFYLTNGYQACLASHKDKHCVDLPSDGGYVYKYVFEFEQGVFIVGVRDNLIQKVQYNSLLTNLVMKANTQTLSWLNANTKCYKSANTNHLNCYSDEQKKLYSALITTGNQLSFSEIKLPSEVSGSLELAWSTDNTFILEAKDANSKDYKKSTLFLVKSKASGQCDLLQKIDSAASFDIKSKDNNDFLIVSKYASVNKLNFHLYNLNNGQEKADSTVSLITNEKSIYKSILNMRASFGTTKTNGQLSLNTMCFFEDYSLTLFNSQGVRYFTREESLAYITNVEFVDFPLIHLQEEFEDEFGHSENDNLFQMFYKRIRSQLIHLREFLFHDLYFNAINFINNFGSNKLGKAKSSSSSSSSSLSVEDITRDEFNLNKLIVVTTSVGKVLGLYTNDNGPVLWSFFLKSIEPFQLNKNKREFTVPLFIQRTSAHFPHEPRCALLAKYEKSKTLVYFFNPLTGQPSKDQSNKDGLVLDYQLRQVFLSNLVNEQFLKPLVLFDQSNVLHVIPETSAKSVVEDQKKRMVMFVSNTDNEKSNYLVGYAMTHVNKPLTELWRVNLEDEQIVSIGAKLPNDRIHSHGKVLGDRSVLYKYLNPNLVGVVTTGQDSQKVPFVNLYLIDTVTGSIVNSFNHKRCRGPVNIVHSENLFFYSYYNTKFRRNEVTSLELFEGSTQFNSTHFSSFDNIKPIYYTKTYIIQKSFEAMQITLTEKGISTKDIIAASQFGIVYEIPSFFIDSRRPLRMTEQDKEENLIPYMPEIPLNYEFSLNYYNYVYNIRGIATAPSGLESTSLVLTYGLDIFFTRVFPSKTFDMLREDFDYFFISTLMVGLVLGTILSKKLANSSNLAKAWK